MTTASDPDDDETVARLEARFERDARLDRWVQARGADLERAYEREGDARTMLALAASAWVRERDGSHDVEQAVAAIASAVAAGVGTNLEPACARLVWATRSARQPGDALEAAEHYAVLGLASARRRREREAAECVWEAIRFVAAARDGDDGDEALARFAELATRRLGNLAALVGAYLPFWSFPYAFRWARAAPPFGRGSGGGVDLVDGSRPDGRLALAYRMGKPRGAIAGALDRCAWHLRRSSPVHRLEHARAVAAIADVAEALERGWAVAGARSPSDAVVRVAGDALTRPFALGDVAPPQILDRARRALVPVLAAEWPDVGEVCVEHDSWRRHGAVAAPAA